MLISESQIKKKKPKMQRTNKTDMVKRARSKKIKILIKNYQRLFFTVCKCNKKIKRFCFLF